jgi:hypothetical protein
MGLALLPGEWRSLKNSDDLSPGRAPRSRARQRWLIAVGAALLLAVGGFVYFIKVLATDRPGVYVSGDTLSIRGTINDQSAADFLRLINPNIKEIRLTSLGGLAEPAIKIGAEIRARNLRVVVDRYCFSACASYIFLGSTSRSINPFSLVAFHNTGSSISEFNFAKADQEVHARYAAEAALEASYYQSVGIDTAWLYRPQLEIRTKCYSFRPGSQKTSFDLIYLSDFSVWIPSRAFLAQAGVTFSGYWPENTEDAASSAARSLPRLESPHRFNLTLGEKFGSADIAALKRMLSSVGPCSVQEMDQFPPPV